MRILYIHQYYCPPGGWGNNRSYDFAQAWAALGHEIWVLTSPAYFPPDHPAAGGGSFRDGPVWVQVLPVTYRQDMGFARRVWAFVAFMLRAAWAITRLQRPDVIYASSTPLTVGLLGGWAAVWHRKRWVFELVDVWPNVPIGMGIIRPGSAMAQLTMGLARWLYRRAAAIVTLSEGMAQQVIESAPNVPTAKLCVIHNGTDTRVFSPRQSLAVSPESTQPVRLVYAGTVGQANGLRLAIMALSQLRTQALRLQSPGLPPWQLDVYGWGNRWDECQQLVSELGLKGSIIFHSPIPKNDLPAKLWTADIGLLTMSDFAVLEANSANKFYDYLAAGLPVLINYEGWQAQYLRQHACGWSTPQGNPEALAAQLSEALRCPAETRQAMGQRGRKLAVERFDRRDLALRTLELLTSLATETKTDAGSPPNAA